jgi:hypothetical protein
MRSLAERVDARVRAACSVYHNVIFFGNFPRGVVDSALNRGQTGLELPAVEVRAIVGNREFDVAHVQQGLSHAGQKRMYQGTSGATGLRTRAEVAGAWASGQAAGTAERAIVRLVAGDVHFKQGARRDV